MQVFQDQKAVLKEAQNTKKTLVSYKSKVLDVTEFKDDHPGGADLVEKYLGQDITEIFHDEDSHQHSKNALKMMDKFQIGTLRGESPTQSEVNSQENSMADASGYPVMTKDKIIYSSFELDLNKGAVWQLMHLPLKQYLEVVHNPVHVPDLKLFDMAFFNFFSRTKWFVIPIFWLPIIATMSVLTITNTEAYTSPLDKYLRWNSPSFSPIAVFLSFCFGLFIWTKTEYCLHRFLFHLDEKITGPICTMFHFIFHGIHHFVPMDKDRLVFPPAGAVPLASLIYGILSIFLGGSLRVLAMAGMLLGYIAYDLIHYYIHHGIPSTWYFKDLKAYHHKHHYKNPKLGFGVSNKLWDYICNTVLP